MKTFTHTLKLGISPCPNDTFMFEALLSGRIDTEGLKFDVEFADIEQLNNQAIATLKTDSGPDVTKVSYSILPAITKAYRILNSGSALGCGNGPLLVGCREISTDDGSLRVVVPGMLTTANMLMDRLYPAITDKTSALFSEIAALVADGSFDAGVLIHEGRFTYKRKGLRLVADLGERWETVTGLPLPLGAIAVSRRLDPDIQRRADRVLRRSVEFALANPAASEDFVRSHAREMDKEVIHSHIELFVNDFSIDIGEDGKRAVRELTGIGGDDIFVR